MYGHRDAGGMSTRWPIGDTGLLNILCPWPVDKAGRGISQRIGQMGKRITYKKQMGDGNMPEFHITVHRPDLTDEERAARMEEIKHAAANLIVGMEKAKKKKEIEPKKQKA